jgi:hypothetical protein
MRPESNLAPLDILVVLKLLAHPAREWKYKELGESVGVSSSQAFSSVNQAARSGLLHFPALHESLNRSTIKEFLIHGLKSAFPPYRGTLTRGIPTAYAGPPLNRILTQSSEPPPVWPYSQGSVRGVELSPLYKTVPKATQNDPKLYELLALIDAIRDGRTREREIAIRELGARIDV